MRMLRAKRSEVVFADTVRSGFLIGHMPGWNRMFWIPPFTPFLHWATLPPFFISRVVMYIAMGFMVYLYRYICTFMSSL